MTFSKFSPPPLILRSWSLGLGLSAVLIIASAVPAQEARLDGRLSFPKPFRIKNLKIQSSRIVLIEEFVRQPPPTPAAFDDWKPERQREWINEWSQTEAGKRYRAKEESRFEQLKKFETESNAQGEFRFKAVPPGNYDLAGELEIDSNGKHFLGDFFARIRVSEVQKIDLERIEVRMRRLLKVGEKAPNFVLRLLDGKKFDLRKQKGRPVLLVFWNPRIPDSVKLLEQAGQLTKSHPKLQLVGIGVGDESDLTSIIAGKHLVGDHAQLTPANRKALADYNLFALPEIWWIGNNRRVRATTEELQNAEFDLLKLANQIKD